MNKQIVLILFTAILISACSSAPKRTAESRGTPAPMADAPTAATGQAGQGGYLQGDGPGADAPADLSAIPDAVPRAEPLQRYTNRPYVALGKTYTPLTAPGNYKERGFASWYGKKFHGQRTSSGEVYDMYAMTAAHPTLPIPSYARVTNLANNKSVVVRVNDRGPFLHERIIDLSYTAAHKLGIVGSGSGEVEVESLVADAAPGVIAVTDSVLTEPLPPASAPTPFSTPAVEGNIYLQLGAFASRPGAESFLVRMRSEFEGSGKQVVLYAKDDLMRVHIGPYATEDEARVTAERLQSRLGFNPFISVH